MIRPERWTPIGGYTLEPNARAAATELGRNVIVVAGPGAGKTEMLAQRADFLLRTGTCRYPRRILAIAFKTDAARNLRDRVADRCGPELAGRLDSYTFHAFAKRIIDRFRPVLTGLDALDRDYEIGTERVERRQITFDDMVPLATQILDNSAVVRNALRNTYSHVFLDEFQDCTTNQYAFVKAGFSTTPAVVTAVGDTKQRIMGWAGALEGIFVRFAEDFEAEALNLYQNFRSAPRLRRVQNAMVRAMDPLAAVTDTEIVGEGGDVDVVEYATATDEAVDLAERIDRWINTDGVPPSEIAVLVRQQPHLYASLLMAELDARRIAYRNEQTVQDEFAEPVGQLIADFLAVTTHDRQPDAYRRLMQVLAPSAGDEESDQQRAARWRRYLARARSEARDVTDGLDGDGVVIAVEGFIDTVGRQRLIALSPSYATGTRLDELLQSILDRCAGFADQGGGAARDLAQLTDDGAVRILTIHKSKGLEFHTVVVLGVEAQTFWSDADSNRAEFFVAISRAKQRLVLTVCAERERPPGAGRWDTARAPHHEFLGYVPT